MRDVSWHFLSTFLENLAIEVLFNADFNGVVQIVDFRQAISVKNYNLSFCTCLDKYISFLAFSITFWGFWPIEHLPPIRNQLGQSFGFACFEGLRSGVRVRKTIVGAEKRQRGQHDQYEQCCTFGLKKSFRKMPLYITLWQLSWSLTRFYSFFLILI